MTQFRIGDLVRLKSGGPTMTVIHVGVPINESRIKITCQWFVGTNLTTEEFPPEALDRAPAKD
ncbi:MAG: DUF2158 domain-containing protein [Candidatus Korobacteraceae bacterium]|jgi:uncharacterized protein YodC (DUF2158 family)